MKRVARLEKGWLGSGNIGRNTTIVRSNYVLEGNEPFYEHSLKLWEGLTRELNYHVMFSQRGIINLYHTDAQRDAIQEGLDELVTRSAIIEGLGQLAQPLDILANVNTGQGIQLGETLDLDQIIQSLFRDGEP